jgi:quinol monooxygenase YgiN
MIYEIVQLTIDPEKRDEFVEVYKEAWNAEHFDGSHNGKIMCAMENPARVDILIEWDTLQAHRQYRGNPQMAAFRAKIDPYMKAWTAEHFEFEDLVP